MSILVCNICSKKYYTSHILKSKYCSRNCQRIAFTGRKIKPFTDEHKNKIRLALTGKPKSEIHKKRLAISKTGVKQNPETIAKRVAKNTGQKRTTKEKQKMSIAAQNGKTGKHHNQLKGSLHPCWKGNYAGYGSLHDWVKRKLGKPTKCEHCGKDGLNGHKIHWANINHEYKRNLSDWIRLCTYCHRKYDLKYNKDGKVVGGTVSLPDSK